MQYLAQQIHAVFSVETERAETIGEPFDYEGVWDMNEILEQEENLDREDKVIVEWEDGKIEKRCKESDEARFNKKPSKRKTTDNVKEDDVVCLTEFEDGKKKSKTELPLIREGCWGEYNPGKVMIAVLQPYTPKPQRVVGRLRARRVLRDPLTRPGFMFRSQDIRLFVRT